MGPLLELVVTVSRIALIVTGMGALGITGMIVFPKTTRKVRKAMGRRAKKIAKKYVRKQKRVAKKAIKKRVKKVKEWRPAGMEPEKGAKVSAHICGAPTKAGGSCRRLTRHENCGRH